ncbi:hypothetical protein PIB30_081199 [Stylosanthes scabra]|uniref:Uncharacterized protein n=1 Tax=Stylosanthes scabra TaxID=79078 RepID=A0ABU6XQ04_9FABA|nr:hypothetical protein [Stylosanthes scabra]
MADNAISFVLNNLSQLLVRQASLLFEVDDKVRSLQSELSMINVLLKTSQGKTKKEIDKEVVRQIRDVAYEAEDIIDTFIVNVAMHKRRTMLERMLHYFEYAKLRHNVAEKIESIKATVNEIRDNKLKFADIFQQEAESSSSTIKEEERVQLMHKKRRNVEEHNVVGFVSESKAVIQLLKEKSTQSNVASIIGMGGLGKTTLARKVYNCHEIKSYFGCRAWVYVSNDCRVKELLIGLIKCLMPNLQYEHGMAVDELKLMVREFLTTRRYLVVLDDLWKTQDWDEVQDAFPNNNNGSKILITSRLKEVASHTSPYPPYYLQLLSEDESWELFSKKVFRGEECPSDIEHLGKQMVKSCGGLPLSIVVLAGLLANKENSHREWSRVVGHVNCYDNLPARLKPCFLYFGMYPEDFEIPLRPLVQKWVAEGFIKQSGTRNAEDVGEDYLYEPIDRSLIQASRVNINGDVKACRIHDLLRDLCISEAKEYKLFEVCRDSNILEGSRPRRVSIQCGMDRYVSSSNNDHSCVRSLFCFDRRHSYNSGEWKCLFKCFKLVRTLDLEMDMCMKVPSNLSLFIHLSGIWNLKQLRHLHTNGSIIVLRGRHSSKASVEVMWNLQTIYFIKFNREIACMLEKGRFPKLRTLGLYISSVDKHNVQHELLSSIQRLTHLRKLQLSFQLKYKVQKPSNYNQMEWHVGCKPIELLHSMQQLSNLSTLFGLCNV